MAGERRGLECAQVQFVLRFLRDHEMQKELLKVLKSTIEELLLSKGQLLISYERCQKIGIKNSHTEDELIDLEALANRYSRTVDMLVHKLFRALDAYELVDGGTLIDAINRAEKRQLIDSAKEIRILKELRNEFAHEYLPKNLTALQEEVFLAAPKVVQIVERSIAFAKKYLASEESR